MNKWGNRINIFARANASQNPTGANKWLFFHALSMKNPFRIIEIVPNLAYPHHVSYN